MEENNQNNTNSPNENKETKKTNTVKAKKQEKSSFSDIVSDHIAEFKKIVWPNRNDVAKKTVTVIITSIFIGAVIFCMDTVFTQLQSLIINVLNW